MRRILASLFIIGLVSKAAFGLSQAYFSDTETSSENVLQAGDIDLLVNGENNPTAIVNFTDLKPGDNSIQNKTLRINTNPARVWLHIKDLVSDQGTQTEPETLEEGTTPKSDIENYLSYDLKVGDTVLISSESATALPDITSCWIPLGEQPGNIIVPMEQSFHFSPLVTNWAQGDTLHFTEEFYAQQLADTSTPDTGTGRVWSTPLKKCIQGDINERHNLQFTCITGCSGLYPHALNISSQDLDTGNFSGTGNYNPNPSYTWNITGNTSGSSFSAHIIYTGLNAGYFTDLLGTIDGGGNITGTATSSTAQTFTWILN